MLARVKSILRQNSFRIYTRPYQLNIVGLRSRFTKSNSFDDEIHVFYKTDNNHWNYHLFPATTDPGTFWLQNPSAPQGTAILAMGQYVDAYGISRHRGKYYALCQIHKPVAVIRDYDRNAVLDFFNGKMQWGMLGMNIHRARPSGTTKVIDEFSAGCQVFANAEDFDRFMHLCEIHRNLYGNLFTYTLVDFRAMRRLVRKRIAVGTGLITLGMLGYSYYNSIHQNQKV